MDYAVGDHPTPRNFLAQAPFSGKSLAGETEPGGTKRNKNMDATPPRLKKEIYAADPNPDERKFWVCTGMHHP